MMKLSLNSLIFWIYIICQLLLFFNTLQLETRESFSLFAWDFSDWTSAAFMLSSRRWFSLKTVPSLFLKHPIFFGMLLSRKRCIFCLISTSPVRWILYAPLCYSAFFIKILIFIEALLFIKSLLSVKTLLSVEELLVFKNVLLYMDAFLWLKRSLSLILYIDAPIIHALVKSQLNNIKKLNNWTPMDNLFTTP